MAMAICSCSKQYSPPLNNIPSTPYAGKSNLKLSSNSSSSYTCSSTTAQYVSFSISTVDILKHEGAELVLDCEEEEVLDISGSGVELKSDCWSSGVLHRRKRRRKRRSRLECEVNCDEVERSFTDRKAGQSCILSSAEEARFSWYIKEKARIEAVRMELLADTNGHELDSRRWAKAAGISHQKLDKILCNGRLSEERVISSYQRFVGSIAASYQGKGLSLEDLTQEGSIGLLRGATKYNPEKGYKLSTYAYWWVRQAITRAIARKSKLIRLPGSIIEHMPKICEAINMLSGRLKRFPTYDEIAEATNLKRSVVRLALDSTRSPISLDKTINSMSIQDIIPGPNELTPDEMVRKDLVEPEVEKLLEVLCEKEAHVVRLYYGLNGNTPWSFEEIGKLLKLSRERVRQINSTALSKLRKIRGINDLQYFV